MENNKKVREYGINIFNEIMRKGNSVKKFKVGEYEETLCDYIENLIHETEEKERVKCFGGNCVIFVASDSTQEKKIFKITNEKESALKEYVISEVTIYFKDINDKWLNQKILGKLKIEKFDLVDEGTKEFISRLISGEKIEHKINF